MRLQYDGSPPTHPFNKPLVMESEGWGRTSEKLDPSNGTKQPVITAADGPIAHVWRCRVARLLQQTLITRDTVYDHSLSMFTSKPPDGLARMER